MEAEPAERIRVLFVDHESRLSGGEQDLLDLIGASTLTCEAHVALPEEGPLSAALAEAGAAVHIIEMAPRLRKLSRWELAKRPWIPLALVWESAKYLRRLGRLMRELRPAFVHTNSMKSHLLAGIVARWNGVTLIWHVRDILNAGWLRQAFTFIGGHMPARVVCISEAVKSQFGRGAAAARAVVVYNGIDVSRFAQADGESFRAELGIGPGAPLVGIVGQIARWKGQDTFIDAAKILHERRPEVRFVVVGECLFPENEADHEESLHSKVAEGALHDVVRFTGWDDDPARVMAALDICVHASRLPEPFGRVIVEAMAAGCAVVASQAGAGPELVGPGEGEVIPPENPPLMASTIERLLDAGIDEMAVAARAGAWRFDIAKTAAGVDELYRRLTPA